MTERLGIPVRSVETARAAVEGAQIVLLATSSGSPVVEADWLAPGAHVNTVGPKFLGHQELGLRVAEAAHVITTDSPEQVRSYERPFFLTGTPHIERMMDLADIWKQGELTFRPSDAAITLFCSVGLAGTETLVADEIIMRAKNFAK